MDDIWSVVDGLITVTDAKDKDRKANSESFYFIIDPVNYVHIEEARTTKDVWNSLKKAFEDGGLTYKVGLLIELVTTRLEEL
ncbi:hypothetical protein PR048_026639 [Dryococelus australis]|uniref:Uncharacterized protein n=1 Tax=Dryococelus australis TaxID=614101 RepID=A0ABQ9GLY2_9NEOP|nr:hypothetical protein PR048_026639 [Dryococelus australis]